MSSESQKTLSTLPFHDSIHLCFSCIDTLSKTSQQEPELLKSGSFNISKNKLEYPGASNAYCDAWKLLKSRVRHWHVNTSNAINIIYDITMTTCKPIPGKIWRMVVFGAWETLSKARNYYTTVPFLLFTIAYCWYYAIETHKEQWKIYL